MIYGGSRGLQIKPRMSYCIISINPLYLFIFQLQPDVVFLPWKSMISDILEKEKLRTKERRKMKMKEYVKCWKLCLVFIDIMKGAHSSRLQCLLWQSLASRNARWPFFPILLSSSRLKTFGLRLSFFVN